MSSLLANLIVLVLCALLLAPLAFIIRGGPLATAISAAAGLFILAVIGYNIWGISGLSPTATADLQLATESPRRCEEVLGLLARAGVVLDRSNPQRPVVARAGWGQLPEEARSVVITCFRSASRGGGEVEVIMR